MKMSKSKVCVLLGLLSIIAIAIFVVINLSPNEKMKNDEKVYQSAVKLIDEAKQTTNTYDAIEKFENAIKKLEGIPKYSKTKETLENAKIEHDKLIIKKLKFCYEYDYLEIDQWLSKMYDLKKKESVSLWMDFSQEVLLENYKIIVEAIKMSLKNPNSFTDVGSKYSYTVIAGNQNGQVLIKKLTYKIDYTATNSFGAAVRDRFEYTFEDIEYAYESQYLTSKEVAKIFEYLTFDDMCEYLLK